MNINYLPKEITLFKDFITEIDLYTKESISGIYFLLMNNEILYIGKTNNISKRLEQHRCYKIFEQVILIEINNMPDQFLVGLETLFIMRLKPKGNIQHNEYRKISHEDFMKDFIDLYARCEEIEYSAPD